MEQRREKIFFLAIKLQVAEKFSKISLRIYLIVSLTMFSVVQNLVCHTEKGTKAERVPSCVDEEDVLA